MRFITVFLYERIYNLTEHWRNILVGMKTIHPIRMEISIYPNCIAL